MILRFSGWLRLWIVLTVIYGALVISFVWIAWPGVKNIPHEKHFIELMSNDALLIAGGKTQPTPIKDKKQPWLNDPTILEMPNGFVFEIPGNTTEEQSKFLARDYVSILQSKARDQQLGLLGKAFAAWIISCLVALLLGMATAWVYRGFKQKL